MTPNWLVNRELNRCCTVVVDDVVTYSKYYIQNNMLGVILTISSNATF